MNKLTTLLVGLALAALTIVCKPETDILGPLNPTPSTGTTNEPGLATEVGKPLGAAITQTIGPSGGTIATPDGSLNLEIPAGALSQATALTLQLVEKTLPSGAGPGFLVSPKSVQLAKPVSVVWHYTASSISGSAPELMCFAYQDEKGVWQGTNNTQVDKVQQLIKARVRSFAHPMSWYEQYFMTPAGYPILPNERVNFRVFFQPGRVDTPSGPDDDIFVPLPGTVESDAALKQLTQSELRSWKVNGELYSTLSDEREYSVGKLNILGRGGRTIYDAPRGMVLKADNPIAVSVELNLKQKGVITMVSNLTMTDPESEFKMGGTTYKEARVEVSTQDGDFTLHIKENKPTDDKDQAFVTLRIKKFTGNGTYEIDQESEIMTVSAHDRIDNYDDSYFPSAASKLKYGPFSVTITEKGGPGNPASGRFSGTLYRRIFEQGGSRYEPITVSGKFRVIDNYFEGG